ncbi:MAG: hypothetical protein JXM70_18805 [Pirellulales bacterium]|nr:hypothetical protein [Pirellulales bacterium]
MNDLLRIAVLIIFVLPIGLMPLLVGCGDTDVCHVSGQVTYNGQAVKAGLVSFEPAQGKSQPQQMPIKDGRYSLSAKAGILPGKYIVRITAPDLARSPINENAGPFDPVPPTVPLLPMNWNVQSTLSVELKSGKNTINFSGEKMSPPQAEVAVK